MLTEVAISIQTGKNLWPKLHSMAEVRGNQGSILNENLTGKKWEESKT